MIREFFMPLDRQFDSGFGATGHAFHDAAKALDTEEHRNGFGLNSNRLPILYLYRHANELYLKSIITILHRRFSADYPHVNKDNFVDITINGKTKKIIQVHSLLHLYNEFRTALSKYSAEITTVGKTDWADVPAGLDELVKLIDDADKASTMFRYPITSDSTNDAKKSPFKSIDPLAAVAEAHKRTNAGKPGVKIIALKNDDNEIVETFIHDAGSMNDVLDALKELSNTLSGAQFGMLHEFLES